MAHDIFRDEARRIMALPTRREQWDVLAVHKRIADDPRLSQVTRDHARLVWDTLSRLCDRILYHSEARRLAAMPAWKRKKALALHRSIADDPQLSQKTRDSIRKSSDTLKRLTDRILRKRKRSS